MRWQVALEWLLKRGHDIVYQTRCDGVRGHFLTVLYLESPVMSFHRSHLIEGEDFEDCVIAARDWVAANTEDWETAEADLDPTVLVTPEKDAAYLQYLKDEADKDDAAHAATEQEPMTISKETIDSTDLRIRTTDAERHGPETE